MTKLQQTHLAACCNVIYSHPLTRWVLGASWHPGGLDLTIKLVELARIGADSLVLDVGSGYGTSAVQLSKATGCRVVGVTLEEEGVRAGYELAKQHGVGERVTFVRGDIQDAELEPERFDVALMECVLSIVTNKAETVHRLGDLLTSDGRLALTDVTVKDALPPELRHVLTTVGCIGDAWSLEEYGALIEADGFTIYECEDLREVATSFLRDVKGKLLMAEVAGKLGKPAVDDDTIEAAKQTIAAAQELLRQRVLSYGLIVAQKPV